MRGRLVSFLLLSFFLMSPNFAKAGPSPKAAPKRVSDDNLTQEFARFRKAQVQAVFYDLKFTFNKGSDQYSGNAVLNTELTRIDQPLTIDFLNKKIGAVRVNGIPVTDFVARTGSFDIPAKYLSEKTRVEVDYTGEFNKDGNGIMRSVDPEDSSEYVFTDFEPYEAHRLFPCFDQPDLKATYAITVDGPKDWKAISNDMIAEAKTKDGRTVTKFQTTKPFSTYLVFVGAGPFAEWKDKFGETPLYIYARKTLAKYVDAKRIFETTKKGLEFYNSYFDYPYPFTKYGHVFIPEFSSGGMENPGAIAMNERSIFRGPVSAARFEGRDSLILHEMAHMWFGDLVTMNWWDDLWLNESFATYLATISQDRTMKAKSAWPDFFSSKAWGYWQDGLVTTHPIETLVPDVRTSKGNFDGITYAKGGAVLKQLHFLVGEEGFRKGIRDYFKTFAFKNTVRADFVSSIAKAANRDLGPWTRAWLQTAGPNRVQAKWVCDNGKVKSFALIQEPSSSKTLSPHRTRVALLKATPEKLEILKTQDVSYSEKKTPVAEFVGAPCPDFVYPNQDDYDYALFALDPVSLKQAKFALTGGAQDPLLRLMVWNTLSQMVRDTQLPVSEYFEIALAGIEKEKDEMALAILLGRHSTVRNYYYGYLTPKERLAMAPRFEDLVWKRTMAEPGGSDPQMTFFDFYVSIAQTDAANAQLGKMLKGEALPKGFKLDQDRRWQLISKLAENGVASTETLIAAEVKKDPTTTGQRNAYAAFAAIPNPTAKTKFWQDLQNHEQIPHSNLRSAADYFNNWNHEDLSASFKTRFLEKIVSMDWQANDNLIGVYFDRMFPQNLCSSTFLSESRAKMQKAKNLTPLAKRAWLEANDELSKCVSVRAKAR